MAGESAAGPALFISPNHLISILQAAAPGDTVMAEESAAGPDAVAVATEAMGAMGREGHRGGRAIRRTMEDMMEAIIEQAYAEEALEVTFLIF